MSFERERDTLFRRMYHHKESVENAASSLKERKIMLLNYLQRNVFHQSKIQEDYCYSPFKIIDIDHVFWKEVFKK
uniref:Uncharacterized protein n=1 Tax=Romanomermis culicivorax TaxID=13658 RepID=A0A915JQR4_ROMCU